MGSACNRMPCDGPESQLHQSQRFQRLKASVDLSVIDIISEVEKAESISFDKKSVAVAAELLLEKIIRTAGDLEAFAQHAKRTTVQTDDLKLLARNNPMLVCSRAEQLFSKIHS